VIRDRFLVALALAGVALVVWSTLALSSALAAGA
jgi:hypothetical protein